ncbi:MAG: hypothetical protein ACRCZA_08080 [Shewanella sp.]|uniref:hypothetical protein n=1 Tax=Shewanella sp. TaxID=50422 RepID=UPI003F34ACD5
MIDVSRVNSIGDLIAALRAKAKTHEERHGLDDWACSLYDVSRLINDSFDADTPIGGAEASAVNVEASEPYIALKAQSEHWRKHCASSEAASQASVNAILGAVTARFDYRRDTAHILALSNKVNRLPSCTQCRGAGQWKPLFVVYDCDKCHGTGRDLADPVAVIIAMQELVQKQQDALIKARGLLFEHGLDEIEKTAIAVDHCYGRG